MRFALVHVLIQGGVQVRIPLVEEADFYLEMFGLHLFCFFNVRHKIRQVTERNTRLCCHNNNVTTHTHTHTCSLSLSLSLSLCVCVSLTHMHCHTCVPTHFFVIHSFQQLVLHKLLLKKILSKDVETCIELD